MIDQSPPPVGWPLVRLRDRMSLLQVAIAAATVAIADGIAPTSLAIAAGFALWAFYRPLPIETPKSTERAWTSLVAVALVATIVRAVLTAEILDAGLDFLLLLVVQRLFNRQRSREHMQLLLLGSLLLVAGAVINVGLNYPLLFAAYLVVAAMTLLLNHLISEGERLGPRTAATMAKEGIRARPLLWRAAGQVAAIAALGAIVTFVAFPRWGVGAFLRGGLTRDSKSGFSSTVELGDFGRIKSDATVVMRIQPQSGDWGMRTDWHLRGSSFDAYEGGKWFHDRDVEATLGYGGPSGFRPIGDLRGSSQLVANRRALPQIVPVPGFERSTEALHALVTLEDIGVDVVFIASEPLGVRLAPRGPIEQRAQMRGGRSDEIRIDKAPGPIRYQFVSRIGTPTEDELASVGDPQVPDAFAMYTREIGGLSDEVTTLARSLTDGKTTRLAKVMAVMDHLGGFAYTLDQPVSQRVVDGADPLEGFLFDTQAGHCEYFASAAVVLLRQVGVPARLVNGYYGAHYNSVGEYYAVRQADAHSWIEVHFGRLGWVTFDPTPPGGRTFGDDAPLWPAFSEWMDAVRNAYLDWIIDYDLGKQLTLFENLGLRDREAETALTRWRWALVAIAVIVVGAWVFGRARRWRRVRARPELALWTMIATALGKRGLVVGEAESPRQFGRRVAEREPAIADAVTGFMSMYDACRFAPSTTTEDLAKLREAARVLAAAIAAVKRR
jgi:transglutaminase-like putative cysteine protease